LSDEAIKGAIRGAVIKEHEFKSTIDELFRRSTSYRNSVASREMIYFCARFRAYAPFNNMLLKVQNPSCAFYATEKHWMAEFGCPIKEDARPMQILAPMHPVMLVYDIDSVENPPVPEKLKHFGSVKGEWDFRRLDRLLENAAGFFVARGLIAKDLVSNIDDALVWPLYLIHDGEQLLGEQVGASNITWKTVTNFTAGLGLKWREHGCVDLTHSLGPEDIFHYAVLHSPGYGRKEIVVRLPR